MQNVKRTKNQTMFALAAMLCALVGATAYAAKGIVQDRRVSLSQAQAMQARAQKSTEFPVVVNDRVLKQLNRYLGTPEGRAFMTASLQRMEGYKRLLDDKFEEFHAPAELMAVPIVESGYQNLEQRQSGGQGAGLWQFIPDTARKFGMRVDAHVDERLNVEQETDAALRYLGMNKLRFRDWQLSLMAYNMGETAVQKAIDDTGTRDPWKLIQGGHENDHDYLASFMAALIILKNPDSLK